MNTPNLRFKGFNDGWKVTLLGDLMSFNNGINAGKDSYGHGRKFINVLDILNNNFIKYNDIIGSVSVSKKVEETNKVEYGDLLFLRSSETRVDVGKSSVYLDEDNFALFGGFVIRGKKQADYHPYFLKLNLESPNVRNQIGSKSGGSTRFNVSQSILNSIQISIPSLNEQTIIAEFISKFDKKIQLQKEKIDLLKQLKKGYMQKIFNQVLRFKDKYGNSYPNWESKKLNEYLAVDGNYNKEHLYGINDVLSVSGEHGIVNQIEFQGRSFAGANLEKYKIVDVGKVVYTKSPLKNNPYGIIKTNLYKSGIVSTLYAVYKIIDKSCIPAFIQYYFESKETVNNYLRPIISKGAKNTINISDVAALENKVSFPCLEEQEKISTFLYAFDQKIKKEYEILTILEEQKRYFMQQMFI